MRVKAVKGVQDLFPPEIEIWQHLEDTARQVFALFGFQEIRTPIMEHTEVFTRSIGETTDIVEKEMYTFPDKAGRSLTLRPEGTASVVRAFVEHHLAKTAPLSRFYYGGPMFRYERPQAGRYRQFHQIGAEAFGTADPMLDAEVLQMLQLFLEAVGLRSVDIQINSIGCPDCRPAYRAAVTSFFSGRLGNLCSDCQRRFETNPLRILDCKVPRCVESKVGAPSVLDHLDAECRGHFDRVLGYLGDLAVPHSVNPSLVRGLDYYTRTTFEVLAAGLGAQNAVAAGGRYDNLISSFGGPPTPAIGFAMGLERLVLLLKDCHESRSHADVFIATLGDAARRKALALASELRRVGLRVELGYGGTLKSQMKRADRLRATWAVIIGEEELASGSGQVRNLADRSQRDLPLQDIVSFVAAEGAP